MPADSIDSATRGARAQARDPTDGQAEEDREAGDRAEQGRLGKDI